MIVKQCEPVIVITQNEYKKLNEASVRLNAIVSMIKQNKYMSINDVLILAGEDVKENEDGRD